MTVKELAEIQADVRAIYLQIEGAENYVKKISSALIEKSKYKDWKVIKMHVNNMGNLFLEIKE